MIKALVSSHQWVFDKFDPSFFQQTELSVFKKGLTRPLIVHQDRVISLHNGIRDDDSLTESIIKNDQISMNRVFGVFLCVRKHISISTLSQQQSDCETDSSTIHFISTPNIHSLLSFISTFPS